ncbi:MAG: hypothetical protein GYA15_15170, partial [Leptolinea sp.]|nr:hypothetical protein [Leptolinea sp.]
MKIKSIFLVLLSCMLWANCSLIDPVQGFYSASIETRDNPAGNPDQSSLSALTPTPDTVEINPITAIPVKAWLVMAYVENNIFLRAISAVDEPWRELGPTGNPVTTRFAASSNLEQLWFSLYSGEDNGLTVMNVTSENSSDLIPLLKSKELPPEKKELLKAEFLREDQPTQVWSQGGTRLAFLDVPTGDKTRLMLYDTSTKSRSAIGPSVNDVTAPIWSPDDQWILYQTIDGFTAQGLPRVTGMRAVRSDGSEDRLLYTPVSLRETVLGWLSADTFVVQSMIERGNRDLRLVSLKDGSSRSLNAGLIKNAGWDDRFQTAMYLLTASETNNEQPNGVYAITASSPQRIILPGKWTSLQFFKQPGIWIASMPGEIGIIKPDGTTSRIKGITAVTAVSPDGKYLVASSQDSGSALYTIDGSPVVSLSNKPVEKAFFTPDSRKLYFTVENS